MRICVLRLEPLGSRAIPTAATWGPYCMRATIRQHCLNARRTLSIEARAEKSHHIARAIWPFLRRDSRIGSYLAMSDEVDLEPFHQQCWSANIAVMVPQITSHTTFAWARYTDPSDLTPGRFGIRTSKQPGVMAWSECDAIIIPMVGFSSDGSRLGMGGGFYDRGLATLTSRTRLIGVAFDCQETAEIDRQWWDIPIPLIITETRTLITRASRYAPR